MSHVPEAISELEYGRDDGAQKRRIVMRRVVQTILIIVLAGGLITGSVKINQYWSAWRAHRHYLETENEEWSYRIPVGTIVYDDHPNAKMPSNVDGYNNYGRGFGFHPPILREDALAWLADGRIGAIDYSRDPSALLLERSAPGAKPRLLLATIGIEDDQSARWICIGHRVAEQRPEFFLDVCVRIDAGEPMRYPLTVVAAPVDEQDTSHFVIPLRFDNRQIDLHGWLRDDGKIKLRVSSGWIETAADGTCGWLWERKDLEQPKNYKPPVPSEWHKGLN